MGYVGVIAAVFVRIILTLKASITTRWRRLFSEQASPAQRISNLAIMFHVEHLIPIALSTRQSTLRGNL